MIRHFKKQEKYIIVLCRGRRSCYGGLLDFQPSSTYWPQGSQIHKATIMGPSLIPNDMKMFHFSNEFQSSKNVKHWTLFLKCIFYVGKCPTM